MFIVLLPAFLCKYYRHRSRLLRAFDIVAIMVLSGYYLKGVIQVYVIQLVIHKGIIMVLVMPGIDLTEVKY